MIIAGDGNADPLLGAGPVDDTFFNDYITHRFTAGQAGTYFIEVSDAINNQGLPNNVTYELNVSVQEHDVDSFIFVPEPVLENENANNGVVSGSLFDSSGNLETVDLQNVGALNFTVDGAGNVESVIGIPTIDSGNFFTLPSDTVGNTDFVGGVIGSNTPYVRVAGAGDSNSSYDVYAFEITDQQLNPPTTVSEVGTGAIVGDGTFFSSITLNLGAASGATDNDVWSLGLRNRT